MAPIYKRGYTGSAVLYGRDQHGVPFRAVMRSTAYCECALGDWIRRNHQTDKNCRDVYQRTPELYDVAAGRTDWVVDDPRRLPEVTTWDQLRHLLDRSLSITHAAPTPSGKQFNAHQFLEHPLADHARSVPAREGEYDNE